MAAKYDDRTAKGWPLPHRGNRLYDDVERLREALNLIDQNITDVETHEEGIEERQDFLDTRMDVIAGQATEDTEILDARVDAEGTVHPNLGHNVRNLHTKILEIITDIKYSVIEFQGLLQEFDELAQTQIQEQLNNRESNERRKEEINAESQVRVVQDDELQTQVDEASNAILQTVLNIRYFNEKVKAKLAKEQENRISDDKILKREIETLAEGFINDLLNLNEAINRGKDALQEEIKSRIDHDRLVQEQIDTASEAVLQNVSNLHQEAEQRRKNISEVHEHLDILDSENTKRESEIETEKSERKSQDEQIFSDLSVERSERQISDKGLAQQANEIAEATLQNSLNIFDVNGRLKADLSREEKQRIEHDKILQSQVERNATAEIENSLVIHVEAEQRREADKRIEYLKNESKYQSEIDDFHQKQIDEAVQANLENSVAVSEAIERQKKILLREEAARIAGDEILQKQLEDTANSGIENSLVIHKEAEKRRRNFSEARERMDTLDVENLARKSEIEAEIIERAKQTEELKEQIESFGEGFTVESLKSETVMRFESDAGLARQIDKVAEAEVQSELNLLKSEQRLKKDLQREEQTRIDKDITLQKQNDSHSQAILQNALNLAKEVQQRRELSECLIQEVHNREQEIQNLLLQIGTLYEIPLPGLDEKLSSLQSQADKNAEANLEISTVIENEAEKRRTISERIKTLENESDNGIVQNTYHQKQLDELVNAILQSAINLHDEIKQRRKFITAESQFHSEKEKILQAEIDKTATAIIKDALSLKNSNDTRRSEDFQERQHRVMQDDGLQIQVNQLAETCLQLSLNQKNQAGVIQKIVEVAGTNFTTDENFNDLINEALNS